MTTETLSIALTAIGMAAALIWLIIRLATVLTAKLTASIPCRTAHSPQRRHGVLPLALTAISTRLFPACGKATPSRRPSRSQSRSQRSMSTSRPSYSRKAREVTYAFN